MSIGCHRFARYCGMIYRCHLFGMINLLCSLLRKGTAMQVAKDPAERHCDASCQGTCLKALRCKLPRILLKGTAMQVAKDPASCTYK